MNSHKQLTKGLLKNFAHRIIEDNERGQPCKADKVYYWDFKDNQIKEENIKKLNTEKDFYSDKVEALLCNKVETPMGRVIKDILDFGETKFELDTMTEYAVIIKQFFNYSVHRGETMRKLVSESLGLKPEDKLITNEQLIKNIDMLPDYFENYFVNILINRTEVPFVLPKSVFYQVCRSNGNKGYIFVLPISPQKAIILEDMEVAEIYKGYQEEAITEYRCTDDAGLVNLFNYRAMKSEMKQEKEFLVGDKETLADLRQRYSAAFCEQE